MYCWGLATSVGMEAQVKALATSLKAEVQMRNLVVRPPYVWLPNSVFAAGLSRFVIPGMLESGHKPIQSPWPDLVISCGRRSVITALGLKHIITRDLKKSAPADVNSEAPENGSFKTRFIHIQDPQINPKHFDLVIAMEHDKVRGENVIHTRYALHQISKRPLNTAAKKHKEEFASYPRPYVSVLLGGSTNKYKLTHDRMHEVIVKLRAMLASMDGSLLITVSRRTGEENIRMLKDVFYENPRVYIYDGTGNNPYMGLLGLADSLVVTNDSVNMMTEAAATGKPLYMLMLSGHHDTKPSRFAERLLADGVARLWGNTWETWEYDICSEMKALPKKIKSKLTIF